MPSLLPLRLPLPSLRSYVIASAVLSVISISYIHFCVVSNHPHVNVFRFEQSLDVAATFRLVVVTIFREPWALLVVLNLLNCGLVLAGRLLMWLVFNSLRLSEIQLARDKLWNFVFYKFIFVFGIMNVQEVAQVVGWFWWFSVLAFVHTFTNVSNHRIRLYSSSPATSRKDLVKLSILLFILFISSVSIFLFTILYPHPSTNTLLFTLAESLILLTKTCYICTKMGWYMGEEWGGGGVGDSYYTDFIFELCVLSIDFLHHLHMLLYGNIFLSMASLVVSMQLRQLFQALRTRILRHLNFQRVVHSMQARFPMVTVADDTCAICWEPLEQARKLPCSHLFHNGCLRSWLEQDVSCPTCRHNLRPTPPIPAPTPPPSLPNFYNRFHFDGSRIFGWLPSFSLEVSHRRINHDSSVLNNMVWQVREVFPQHSVQSIRADLRTTLSTQATLNNIAEGRLVSDSDVHYVQTLAAITATPTHTPTSTTPSIATPTTQHTTTMTTHLTTTTTISDTSAAATLQPTTASSSITTSPSSTTPIVDLSFSARSEERERLLRARKSHMIQMARRKFEKMEERNGEEVEAGVVVEGVGGQGRGEGSSVD